MFFFGEGGGGTYNGLGWVEMISKKVAFHQPTLTPWFTLILLWGKNVLGEIK